MHAGFASPPIIERWECYHKNFKPVSDIAKPSQRAQIRIEYRDDIRARGSHGFSDPDGMAFILDEDANIAAYMLTTPA